MQLPKPGNIEAAFTAVTLTKAEKIDTDAERFYQRMDRRYDRILQWASTKEKSYIADHLAFLLLLVLEERKSTNLRDNMKDDVLREMSLKLRKHRFDRQQAVTHKPKQKAKLEAFKLWQERYAGQHVRLRTNEQFATEVMRRWPVLTSSKVICGWCTKWQKLAKARGTSAS